MTVEIPAEIVDDVLEGIQRMIRHFEGNMKKREAARRRVKKIVNPMREVWAERDNNRLLLLRDLHMDIDERK